MGPVETKKVRELCEKDGERERKIENGFLTKKKAKNRLRTRRY